jgi:DNA-binding beta-propeller fold protein YncE
LTLAGGRRLEFVRSFSSESDVRTKRSFWSKVVDWIAGPPNLRRMLRPYGLAVDSRGRVIITDPGAGGVHIFDFEKQKYAFLEGGKGVTFRAPQGVAVDAIDRIYVTDSELGFVFVFDAGGKFNRYLGRLKGGEGIFKRPTGIAVDAPAGRAFVIDTLRHKIYVLRLDGTVLSSFGERGLQPGQFNFPTEIVFRRGELAVVDAMNFRVQTFSSDGKFLRTFGSLGERTGFLLRPKGLALDSEANVYVVDGLLETVQVFDRDGRLLYFFGQSGSQPAQFQLPAGLFIDSRDRIFIADSYNQRVQVFQYGAAVRASSGSGP